MPGALLRPFPIFVLAAAAATAGVVGFTASAGVRDDMLVASVVALLAAAATGWMLARRPGFAALVAPVGGQASRALVPILLCWCAFALGFGPASIPPQWNAVWTTAQTVLTFVLLAFVLRQLREPGAADARQPVLTQSLPT